MKKLFLCVGICIAAAGYAHADGCALTIINHSYTCPRGCANDGAVEVSATITAPCYGKTGYVYLSALDPDHDYPVAWVKRPRFVLVRDSETPERVTVRLKRIQVADRTGTGSVSLPFSLSVVSARGADVHSVQFEIPWQTP
jgi:hypothetical protein